MDADVKFGRQVIAACLCCIVLLAATSGYAIRYQWWLGVVFLWLGFGFASVVYQVFTNFGYLRLAPRFDCVVSFTLSVIAGPVSLTNQLLRRLTRAV
jgi:hypothetical protein